MKSIYLILTKSTSVVSCLIGRFTADPYTHVSIAFEPSTLVMYSFARRYARLPLPAGLVEEHMDRGFYRTQGDIPCCVLRLDVDNKTYYRARNRVMAMLCRQREYRYSLLGLIACKFGIPVEVPGYYFCSQFVAEILSECCQVNLPHPASLMHPADYIDMDCFQCVFCGRLKEFLRVSAA